MVFWPFQSLRVNIKISRLKNFQMSKLLCLLSIFFSLSANAQIKIEGLIYIGNKPLPAISVSMVNETKFHQVTQSDSLGKYFFKDLEKGTFSLQFSSINFKQKKITVTLNGDTTIT
ncbi:MAG: hypothetical protein EOP55_01805, partial [Sphingobacteriales bacterium]